jgi:ribosomal protein L7/L12
METIKKIREEFGISLGTAKELVSQHPKWAKIVIATRPLLDDLDKTLLDE